MDAGSIRTRSCTPLLVPAGIACAPGRSVIPRSKRVSAERSVGAATALSPETPRGLGVVVLISILPITVTVLHFEREFTRLSRQAQDQSGVVATHVEEAALGVRVVKSFGREDYVFDRFDQQVTDLYDIQVRKVAVSARFWTLLEVIPNLTLIVVLGFGAYAAGHGLVTMGTLVAFITMMLSLVWPIASLGFLLSMTQESMTAANRVAEIFDAPVEITDGPRGEILRDASPVVPRARISAGCDPPRSRANNVVRPAAHPVHWPGVQRPAGQPHG